MPSDVLYDPKYPEALEPRLPEYTIPQPEQDRLKAILRPAAKKSDIWIQFEDIVQSNTFGLYQSIKDHFKELKKAWETEFEDLESVFMFHCKGFGTPSVQKLSQDIKPDDQFSDRQALNDGLYALKLLGYSVHLISSQPDTEVNRDYMAQWLLRRGIRIGSGRFDLVRSIILPLSAEPSSDDESLGGSVKKETKRLEEGGMIRIPPGVDISQEDECVIRDMRRRQLCGKSYLSALADLMLQNPIKAYLSPSASDLEILTQLLSRSTERTYPPQAHVLHHDQAQQAITPVQPPDMFDLILYGGYPWNEIKPDFNLPGAWLSYSERMERGLKLGDEYDLPDVIRLRGWKSVRRYFSDHTAQ